MKPYSIDRRTFLKTSLVAGAISATRWPVGGREGTRTGNGDWGRFEGVPGSEKIAAREQIACSRLPGTRLKLEGRAAEYVAAVTEQWLKVVPASNPAILEMFRDRDRRPPREMVPWAGEFAGKYLTSGVEILRVSDDPALRKFFAEFTHHLIRLQAEDGYLGPWPKESRLTGHAPNCGPKGGETWDAWGHYHIMLGLLLWHEDTGDPAALACATRIGDLFCARFSKARLVDTGSTEMNLAPIHSLALLFRRTGEDRFLQLARKICDEFSATDREGKLLAGDYLNAALAGKEFFQMAKPRWESLHPIMGLVELFRCTGEAKYRRAFEQIWWSIVKLDRHNTGGFSSGEQAQGNPYHQGAIETCCTIAWTAMTLEMLHLSRNSVVADELELSTLNSILGSHSPSGRWVTYNTPMDGVRRASAHEIVFQAREGSPELNCCSVNGPRGLGMIGDWALMGCAGGLLVNWYGPCTMTAHLPSGAQIRLTQQTAYPCAGTVRLRIDVSRRENFALGLRIPHWSAKTGAKLNGRPVNPIPGTYLVLERTWKTGDVIDLEFDFSLHFWAGERECENKVSIYRGPLLLAYDRRFNAVDPDQIPPLTGSHLNEKVITTGEWMPPLLLLECTGADGRAVRLCDFASAGLGGSPYRSWLEVRGIAPTAFSPRNPLRTSRVAG